MGERARYKCGQFFSLPWPQTWYNSSVFLPGGECKMHKILCPGKFTWKEKVKFEKAGE